MVYFPKTCSQIKPHAKKFRIFVTSKEVIYKRTRSIKIEEYLISNS